MGYLYDKDLNKDYGYSTQSSELPMEKTDSLMSGSDKLGYAQIGGSFLSNYLARRAAEFENKRKLALQAAQGLQEGQQNSYDTMLKVLTNAMLGGR